MRSAFHHKHHKAGIKCRETCFLARTLDGKAFDVFISATALPNRPWPISQEIIPAARPMPMRIEGGQKTFAIEAQCMKP